MKINSNHKRFRFSVSPLTQKTGIPVQMAEYWGREPTRGNNSPRTVCDPLDNQKARHSQRLTTCRMSPADVRVRTNSGFFSWVCG